MSTQEFLQILSALMLADNTQRKQAEQCYNDLLDKNLKPTLEALVGFLSSTDFQVIHRSLAGVLLRRAIEKYSKLLDAAFVGAMRQSLITIWIAETDGHLLKRISHILAQW